ncbi:20S proteasome subunit A/B [Halorubrum sp. CSM-61]|uniref:20S proteasome subunit A/B n=1 Tax=Halorubrum sp. CSM-61 TaxID=2485838 RepID=UPI000F4D0063|nr:20S proteasome subunit A/B [Halorubrum sp. CSM-61]
MSTVVAIETPTGVAIAGDTRLVDGDAVSSDQFRRVFGLKGVGVGVVGESGAVQQFRRQFEVKLRDRGLRSEKTPDIDVIARIAAREAEDAGVDAVIGARDDDGTATLREVASDGRVLEGGEVALGSGREIAIGLLEALDADEAANDPAAAVRNTLETVTERDVNTGGEINVWTLGSADQIEKDVRRSEDGAER